MVRVFLKIPVHRSVEALHAVALLALQKYELGRGVVDLDISFLIGESLISRARNTIAYDFLESGADYLFMLDSDIVFPANVLERLLGRRKGLVGVNYLHKTDVAIKRAGVCVADWNEFGEAVFVPTGCMLVERGVFLRILDAGLVDFYDTSVQSGVAGFFIPYVNEDGVYLSEDWAFSERCRKAGVKGWLDNTIKLGHVGTKVYKDV